MAKWTLASRCLEIPARIVAGQSALMVLPGVTSHFPFSGPFPKEDRAAQAGGVHQWPQSPFPQHREGRAAPNAPRYLNLSQAAKKLKGLPGVRRRG